MAARSLIAVAINQRILVDFALRDLFWALMSVFLEINWSMET
jgi:hypothetical protein